MRNQNPKNVIMSLAECVPSMRYDGCEDFSLWQQRSREMLRRLAGTDLIPECDDDFLVKSVTDCGDYTDTYFSFQSEKGYYVPCHILKPKKYQGKLPLLICLQGHTTGMHISIGKAIYEDDSDDINSGDRDYALYGVKNGYCAVTVEQRYMGECGGTKAGPACLHRPADSINALPALLFGRTAIGERIHDVSRAVDVITNPENAVFDCIDSEKIILTGNSGGGTTAFYTACLDERIKIALPSCSVCTYRDSIIDIGHCACNYIPSIARYFDMGDLCGLVAPRRLVILAGEKDSIFPIEGVKSAYNLGKSLYKQAGCEENISLLVGNEGHRYYRNSAFGKLKNLLKP